MDTTDTTWLILGAAVLALVVLAVINEALAAHHRKDLMDAADRAAARTTPLGQRPALSKVRAEDRSAAAAVLDALDRVPGGPSAPERIRAVLTAPTGRTEAALTALGITIPPVPDERPDAILDALGAALTDATPAVRTQVLADVFGRDAPRAAVVVLARRAAREAVAAERTATDPAPAGEVVTERSLSEAPAEPDVVRESPLTDPDPEQDVRVVTALNVIRHWGEHGNPDLPDPVALPAASPPVWVAVTDGRAHALHLTPEQLSTLTEDGRLLPTPGHALPLACGAITTRAVTTRENGLPRCPTCTTPSEEPPG